MTVEDIIQIKNSCACLKQPSHGARAGVKKKPVSPICIKTEHELRCSEGTQVPEPRMVTVMPDFSDDISSLFGLA